MALSLLPCFPLATGTAIRLFHSGTWQQVNMHGLWEDTASTSTTGASGNCILNPGSVSLQAEYGKKLKNLKMPCSE